MRRSLRVVPASVVCLVLAGLGLTSSALVRGQALATGGGAHRDRLTDSRVDSVTAARVDAVFARWDHTDSPGCALGVSRGGRVVYERGYGMATLEYDLAISPASVFHVASISKQVTAMAILLLARDGKLSLDDDVRTYIPELPDYGHRITLRHLLTHTSGLRDQWELLELARGRFGEDLITERDVMEIVARQRALNFTPGSEYLYSNTGYTLLAVIVRRVSGTSLRQFAAERIFEPLGMTHTHFHDDHTMIVKNRTSAYEPRAGGGWKVSVPFFDTYGATSLFTTVGDLLRWEANFDDPAPRVGDSALFRAMQTSAVLANGDSIGYGLGLALERYRGVRLVGHSGADAGYRAYVGRFPEHQLAIAVLCDLSTVNPAALARRVADLFLPATLAAALPDSAAVAVPAAQLAAYAGVYTNPASGEIIHLTVRDGALVEGRAGGPPLGPRLIPLDGHRFRIPGGSTEIVFPESTGDGTRPVGTMFLTRAGRRAERFERRASSTRRPGELAQFAGDYYSEELGATYRVTVRDSGLALATRMGEGVTVHPAFGDTFDDDYGYVSVRFTRDHRGVVDGVLVSTPRVRAVRFTRQHPGPGEPAQPGGRDQRSSGKS